jgi:hypothetical protein
MKISRLSLIILAIFGFVSVTQIKADILILQYGNIVTGKIIHQDDADGFDFETISGKVHYPDSMVKDARIDEAESPTNRIPN